MSRHGHKEVERLKRVAAKMVVEPSVGKAHSPAPPGSVLALVSDWRKKADILSEQLRFEPHGNYQWHLQGRAHALRDAAMELEKALNPKGHR